jgi:hypothetical protein
LDGGEIRVCGVSDLDAKPIIGLDVVVQVDAVDTAQLPERLDSPLA